MYPDLISERLPGIVGTGSFGRLVFEAGHFGLLLPLSLVASDSRGVIHRDARSPRHRFTTAMLFLLHDT